MEKTLRELSGEIVSIKGRPQQDDCLFFTCPICRDDRGELIGHGIMVSWLPPSLYEGGRGALWSRTGSTIDDISISPSINCDVPCEDGSPSPCKFHGWVKDGKVTW
jgi:hypothetical protein